MSLRRYHFESDRQMLAKMRPNPDGAYVLHGDLPKEHHEVIICNRCGGKGVNLHSEPTGDYSNRLIKRHCDKCEGSGRLLKISTLRYEPYKEGDLLL